MSLEGSHFLFEHLTRSMPIEYEDEDGVVDITEKAQSGFEFALDALTLGGFTSMRLRNGENKYSRFQGRYSKVFLKGKQGKYEVSMSSTQDFETQIWLYISDPDFPFTGRQVYLRRSTLVTETEGGETRTYEDNAFMGSIAFSKEKRISEMDDNQVSQFLDEILEAEIDEDATKVAFDDAIGKLPAQQGNDKIISVQWNSENEDGSNVAMR